MGTMISVSCNHQKHEFHLGVGMLYPITYEETVEKINAGKYGKKIKNTFNSKKYTVVNLEQCMYICKECGQIELLMPMDLYTPKDENKFAKADYGIHTVEGWGKVPYWWPGMHDDCEFELVLPVEHYCKKCKNKLARISEEELKTTECPKCHKNYTITSLGLWD